MTRLGRIYTAVRKQCARRVAAGTVVAGEYVNRFSVRRWNWIFAVSCTVIVGAAIAARPAGAQEPCESLASMKITNVTITMAEPITPPFEAPSLPGRYGTPAGEKVTVPFCRVAGYAAPTRGSTSTSRYGYRRRRNGTDCIWGRAIRDSSERSATAEWC